MRPRKRLADKNERMIELKVRFWTNNIARPKRGGLIVPKHAWDSGVVRMDRNGSHDSCAAPFISIPSPGSAEQSNRP